MKLCLGRNTKVTGTIAKPSTSIKQPDVAKQLANASEATLIDRRNRPDARVDTTVLAVIRFWKARARFRSKIKRECSET